MKGPLASRAYTYPWDWGANPTQIIVIGFTKCDSKTWFGVDMKEEEEFAKGQFLEHIYIIGMKRPMLDI